MISKKVTGISIETSVTKNTNLPTSARLVVISSDFLEVEENEEIRKECEKMGIRLEWAGNPEKVGEKEYRKLFAIEEVPEEFLREFSLTELKEIFRERNLIPGNFLKEEQERLLEKIAKRLF